MKESGYALKSERLITALPRVGFDLHSFHTPAAVPTRLVDEGDIIDLGNRHFQVPHLPDHSPGSIGLWEEKTGTLFSGDAIYNGPLLDTLEDSGIEDYLKTMERLQNLPINAVHGGHDESFDRSRLKEITAEYISSRGRKQTRAGNIPAKLLIGDTGQNYIEENYEAYQLYNRRRVFPIAGVPDRSI